MTSHKQTQKEGFKTLFLASAQRYLNSEPDAGIELYPEAFGEAISVLLGAYRLNQTPIYLQRAQQLAAQAQTLFFADGALPRASSRVSLYEAITRGDTLVMALLDLWAIQNRPKLDLGLIWADR